MQNLPFSNANVPLADLPDVEHFDWQALSPRYMPLNFVLNVVVTLVLGLIWWLSHTRHYLPSLSTISLWRTG